ncbi:hypothetical protein [Truepera radiovictrix]|uniref:Lipoprotein n=1 Tax=Truepera radiovictrix (strain DSM 17093 / CIP 108686 / LMG 22925 / RQ-24) TaxID=649638 RepID=D7CXR7_TRURR|nr:hypothetical protein [Truepera radiovictrix]ADI14669.1 hypothetical protein Trad_1550 [Truepera radiovictrix DSM 17093]WMT56781.1 hypothetical protein RCV51_12280 [Truepera radiovictrix]
MNRRYRSMLVLLIPLLLLAGCRNETQNRIRREIQDFTGQRMFITVYAFDGTPVYEGRTNGQVTRSVSSVVNGAPTELASYVYWFDETGRYFQTNMPYLLSSAPLTPAQGGGASTTPTAP